MQADEVLNAGETGCGELIQLIFTRMKSFQPGRVLEVVTYDPGAAEDIPAWCRMTANTLLKVVNNDTTVSYFIRKKEES